MSARHTAAVTALNALEHENACLRDALAWYAQASNWRREVRNVGLKRITWSNSNAANDRGGRARMALLGMGAAE